LWANVEKSTVAKTVKRQENKNLSTISIPVVTAKEEEKNCAMLVT